MDIKNEKILLYLKLDPSAVPPGELIRDVSTIGHFGTGDVEVTVSKAADLDLAKPYIRMAYEQVGG